MKWPFETMSAQEVFDKVAEHLLTQNKKSIGLNGGCCYRGENGLTCAAGCLIPDDKYSPQMERQPWGDICVSRWNFSLITDLQITHDRFAPKDWKNELKNLAIRYNLEFKFDDFVPGEQT